MSFTDSASRDHNFYHLGRGGCGFCPSVPGIPGVLQRVTSSIHTSGGQCLKSALWAIPAANEMKAGKESPPSRESLPDGAIWERAHFLVLVMPSLVLSVLATLLGSQGWTSGKRGTFFLSTGTSGSWVLVAEHLACH